MCTLFQRVEQQRTLAQTGRLHVGQRSLHLDGKNQIVWGVDEYGCDLIVSQTELEFDWVTRALDWINQSKGPELVHPAEFVYT